MSSQVQRRAGRASTAPDRLWCLHSSSFCLEGPGAPWLRQPRSSRYSPVLALSRPTPRAHPADSLYSSACLSAQRQIQTLQEVSPNPSQGLCCGGGTLMRALSHRTELDSSALKRHVGPGVAAKGLWSKPPPHSHQAPHKYHHSLWCCDPALSPQHAPSHHQASAYFFSSSPQPEFGSSG